MTKTFCMGAILAAALAMVPAASAEDASFDSKGVNIHYSNDGTGEPVILIHGYQATGLLNWKMTGVVRLLSKDYRVITMDVRGHGKSDSSPDDKYGVEAVHDVVRMMDHLNIEKAHIVGYSMGGMITIKMLTMYPERVKSAVVGGMGWVAPGSIRLQIENADDKFVKIFNGFPEYSTTKEEMLAIQAPLTVIVGTKDMSQLRRVEQWQEIVPDLPVVYVEGAQHMNCVFRPDFRNGIKTFVDEHAG